MLQQLATRPPRRKSTQLVYSFARSPAEVAEAQRLRYQVFSRELGALLPGSDGHDRDGFDACCEHLLVRDSDSGAVVGTYRILSPVMAREAGGFYAEREFDLSRLTRLLDRTVEVGRACVHPDYRHGGAITLLWSGLARYMQQHRYEYMLGCASINIADGGHHAASLYHRLHPDHLSPAEYRVFPHCPLPLQALRRDLQVSCPALIKGYLRLGAYICGEPALDAHFNTADMLVMLPLSRMDKRYAAHFFDKPRI